MLLIAIFSNNRNPADVRTNRGNFLLLKMLAHRYPQIMNEEAEQVVTQWLSFTEERKGTFTLPPVLSLCYQSMFSSIDSSYFC